MQELHPRCKEHYSIIGKKNTYKILLSECIYNLGSMDALHEALSIMSRVIQSFLPEGIGSAAVAEVNARGILSSS